MGGAQDSSDSGSAAGASASASGSSGAAVSSTGASCSAGASSAGAVASGAGASSAGASSAGASSAGALLGGSVLGRSGVLQRRRLLRVGGRGRLRVHGGPQVAEAGDAGAGEHVVAATATAGAGVAAGALAAGGRLVAGHALDAQRQAPALGVDLQDLDLDVLAGLHDLTRVLHVVVGQLGDVHQALDAVHDLDERAEGDDLRDLALELVAQVVGVHDALPGVLLGLLETQRDALAVAVDVQHLDRHGVADREDLGRVVHVAPGQLGDVDQAVDAVQVHERAEVDDVRDVALHDLAGLQAVQDLLADLLALLLQNGAAREHHVVARAVELDDLALDLGGHELVQVLHPADVHQRRGQEATHAEIDDQAALDDLDDRALDRLAGLGGGLDAPPRLLEAGALLGQQQAAVLVLLGEDQRVDLFTQLHLVRGIHGLPDAQLVGEDDSLALVADVDKDFVLVDPDDVAGHHITFFEGDERGVVVGDDLAVDLQQEAVGALYGLGGWG